MSGSGPIELIRLAKRGTTAAVRKPVTPGDSTAHPLHGALRTVVHLAQISHKCSAGGVQDQCGRPDDRHEVMYRPGRPVWIDLAKVYPVDSTEVTVPDGMDLQARTPATLKMRGRTTTGHLIGWVAYQTGEPGKGAVAHGQWVLWDAISERDNGGD
jgi:hypothetical protein